MFYVGVPMGYGGVKTLTDNSMKNCLGDMRAFQPTIMVGVPAVWELIRKGINSKVAAGGALKSKVFEGALAAKKASPGILGPITDAVVFKAVKQATGGRLKYALSGGAMISKETHEFLRLALTNLIQGYGASSSISASAFFWQLISESGDRYDRILRVRMRNEVLEIMQSNPLLLFFYSMCGESLFDPWVQRKVQLTPLSAILPPSMGKLESVGIPVPSIEVKLVDVEEAGYFANKKPSQGEIWIRGNSITKGYFKVCLLAFCCALFFPSLSLSDVFFLFPLCAYLA